MRISENYQYCTGISFFTMIISGNLKNIHGLLIDFNDFNNIFMEIISKHPNKCCIEEMSHITTLTYRTN